MIVPEIPDNEVSRLRALQATGLLDTDREAVFENLTQLIAMSFDVPIVAISLIDKNRQWFKSIQGLDACETHRDISFCGHVVFHDSALIVEDARLDERFDDNPLVAGEPNIVFYAGVPIAFKYEKQTYAIGSLCLIDQQARTLTDRQLVVLKQFAKQVEETINTRLETIITTNESAIKSQFLANMTHELRTPVSAVISMLEVIKLNADDDILMKQVSIAEKSAHIGLSVIEDILTFSRIDAGEINVLQEEFRLAECFLDLMNMFENANKTSQKQFLFAHDWDASLIVKGDEAKLKQVLFNILSNADKFTFTGEIQVLAHIEIIESNLVKLHCTISDTGIGMTEQQRRNLFQPFQQFETQADRRFGGSGLGLSISQALISAMGGNITVSSHEGKGSTFSFDVMLETVSTDGHVTKQADNNEFDSLSQLNVLVVEDDMTNTIIAEHLLSHLNISYESVSNGIEGLAALQKTQFDLILLDCQMPEMDGYEMSRQIRLGHSGCNPPTIPIIALTANSLQADREECVAAGMNDFLSKPINIEELTRKIYLNTLNA